MKLQSNDLLAILRKFKIAGDEHVPRHIEHVKLSYPQEKTTLASFRFNKRNYYVLVDDNAEDDTQYIYDQVRTAKADVLGEIIPNPGDDITSYALPFKGKEVYLFGTLSDKKRLDVVLAEKYPESSRSTWQKHIKAGHISVNGSVQASPKFDVSSSDKIELNVPDATDFSGEELPVIHMDDNVVVIDKPIGILAHSKGELNDEFTVASFFARYSTADSDTNRPGIVHRLDRDTSGVMIGARTPESALLLKKQFSQRTVKKTYIALVSGQPAHNKATIDIPIARNPSAPSTFKPDVKGKSAITHYEMLATDGVHSLLLLKPVTGRTHQLRVHLKYLGTPIVGDRVYGSEKADRLYLHAKSLEITIPVSDRRVFEASVPPEFTKEFPDVQL